MGYSESFKRKTNRAMTKGQFIEGMNNWSSHLVLLWDALEATKGDVVELGMGDGSTPKLHEYCKEKDRKLFSYENNLEWYRKYEHLRTPNHSIEYTQDWLEPVQKHRDQIGVLFSDEAPGHIRKYNIAIFAQNAIAIVAHDAEPQGEHGYMYSLVKPLFKYEKYFEFEGTGAIYLSNFIEI